MAGFIDKIRFCGSNHVYIMTATPITQVLALICL